MTHLTEPTRRMEGTGNLSRMNGNGHGESECNGSNRSNGTTAAPFDAAPLSQAALDKPQFPNHKPLSLHFVSGLPRSGSTLLMNLLGQCPRHTVTPTSGLIDMMVGARNQWMHNVWFKAEGLEQVKPKMLSMLRGMLLGYHEQSFRAGRVVFDKNRGWIAYLELLEEILERKIKPIVMVRDIKAIIASFEKIHRTSALTKHGAPESAFFDMQTIEGRARQLLSPGAVAGISVNRLRDALDRGLADRLLILPYRHLTTQPAATMQRLHQLLGLPPFAYNPDQVEQLTHEDDTYHGMSLHTIRRRVEPPKACPWEGVLPDRVCAWLDREYADVNQLASL